MYRQHGEGCWVSGTVTCAGARKDEEPLACCCCTVEALSRATVVGSCCGVGEGGMSGKIVKCADVRPESNPVRTKEKDERGNNY